MRRAFLEIGIVEMGANHQKEIDFLGKLAQPRPRETYLIFYALIVRSPNSLIAQIINSIVYHDLCGEYRPIVKSSQSSSW